ncbi:hypothetical protein STAQ_37040 [Allostella sp. ATCC 35155]|nr:hypothetical protein STAQ_37040 [Stella sp. ATCC 35155]
MTDAAVDYPPPWQLPTLRAVLALAARRGLTPRHVGGGLVHLGEGARLCRLDGIASDRTPFLAGQLCRSRWLTYRTWLQAGLPVPETAPAQSVQAATAAAAKIGRPVVLRPIQAPPMVAPSPPVAGADAVAAAFGRHTPRGAVVSAAVPGPVGRHLIVDGAWRPAVAGGEVPHPLDRLLVERAAAVCDIELAVVELTGARPDRPFTETGAMLTALDAGLMPAASIAADPDSFAALYLDHLFPAAGDGRIPLVATIGIGAAALAEEIAAGFAAAGRTVGLATRSGLSVDGLRLMSDDRRGAAGLDLLVDHGAVEAAVIELPPGGCALAHPALDVLVLAAPMGAADILPLLPNLRRGIVGAPVADLDGAAAAAGLAWRAADAASAAGTAIALSLQRTD